MNECICAWLVFETLVSLEELQDAMSSICVRMSATVAAAADGALLLISVSVKVHHHTKRVI